MKMSNTGDFMAPHNVLDSNNNIPKTPKSPFSSKILMSPLPSPMKKALTYMEEIGNLTKLNDPQDDWLPITESRSGNAYYAAFHTLSSGIGVQVLLLPLAFVTLGCMCKKDMLIQSGLYKTLKERPTSGKGDKDSEKSESSKDSEKFRISDEEWEELDIKAASQIRLCLAKNVLANVIGLSTTKELWEKLEELYQTKSISNKLYLKEQFHKLQMAEGITIYDHLSVLNGIVSELESIGVKIDDEDKAFQLI
ncbi:hypothetical protein FXO38_36064 [Capsicum annuum]|nr:hypothetical protein FXO38_36064 [Capsicum annuum]KAF3617281.1 hypothetical protein FXO37_34703 [Capsicum annuum]